jgi:hypothetical protein
LIIDPDTLDPRSRYKLLIGSVVPRPTAWTSTVSAPVIEGSDLRPMLLELLAQEVMISGLPGKAVPVLCQHHRDAAGGHVVSHTVHAGAL